MDENEAPASKRKPPATATPSTCGHRARRRLYPISGGGLRSRQLVRAAIHQPEVARCTWRRSLRSVLRSALPPDEPSLQGIEGTHGLGNGASRSDCRRKSNHLPSRGSSAMCDYIACCCRAAAIVRREFGKVVEARQEICLAEPSSPVERVSDLQSRVW